MAAVHDGYVLRKSVHSTPMGGRLLSQCMQVRAAGPVCLRTPPVSWSWLLCRPCCVPRARDWS